MRCVNVNVVVNVACVVHVDGAFLLPVTLPLPQLLSCLVPSCPHLLLLLLLLLSFVLLLQPGNKRESCDDALTLLRADVAHK